MIQPYAVTPDKIKAKNGAYVEFNCLLPNASWTFNNGLIPLNALSIPNDNFTRILQINYVTHTNAGLYTCSMEVDNIVHEDTGIISVLSILIYNC